MYAGTVMFAEVVCSPLPPMKPYLLMTVTAVNFGSELIFKCTHGRELNGSSTRTCLENGTWDGSDAECTGETYVLCRNV